MPSQKEMIWIKINQILSRASIASSSLLSLIEISANIINARGAYFGPLAISTISLKP